jgi:hypothetical protein
MRGKRVKFSPLAVVMQKQGGSVDSACRQQRAVRCPPAGLLLRESISFVVLLSC